MICFQKLLIRHNRPSGTEFFTEFRTKQMCAEKMHFDWDQTFVNAELKLPNSPIVNDIPLDWLEYKVCTFHIVQCTIALPEISRIFDIPLLRDKMIVSSID